MAQRFKFAATFQETINPLPVAILMTKRRGLLQTVCMALGNIGDVSTLPALSQAAKDSEPLIAEHARWALKRIQNKEKV
jgi:epoxyqueuosine reductase